MEKRDMYDYNLNSVDNGAEEYEDKGTYQANLNTIIVSAPYVKSCEDSFSKDYVNKTDSYFNAYMVDYRKKIEKPDLEKEITYLKKRPFMMILIIILSLICIAVPFVSSLELIKDYINIGYDVLSLTSIIQQEITLVTLTDNLAVILIAAYILVLALILFKAIFALIGRKNLRFALISFIAIIVVINLIIYINPNLFYNFSVEINSIINNYGLMAMLSLPFVIIITSKLSYSRLKDK